MLFVGLGRIGKNCALGLEYAAEGHTRDLIETKGTVFPNTDLLAGK